MKNHLPNSSPYGPRYILGCSAEARNLIDLTWSAWPERGLRHLSSVAYGSIRNLNQHVGHDRQLGAHDGLTIAGMCGTVLYHNETAEARILDARTGTQIGVPAHRTSPKPHARPSARASEPECRYWKHPLTHRTADGAPDITSQNSVPPSIGADARRPYAWYLPPRDKGLGPCEELRRYNYSSTQARDLFYQNIMSPRSSSGPWRKKGRETAKTGASVSIETNGHGPKRTDTDRNTRRSFRRDRIKGREPLRICTAVIHTSLDKWTTRADGVCVCCIAQKAELRKTRKDSGRRIYKHVSANRVKHSREHTAFPLRDSYCNARRRVDMNTAVVLVTTRKTQIIPEHRHDRGAR
ncbi:hypothetical protein HYPSUDRAFT_55004 [Hypholoma sublateritium FD-334 SS-4]|uniref:Uncharacterized protein n=1 Tax=Hypholoma sublateritium (strain FD-334 SS-4) TaxID=945553 RepID=A0A0D2L627_HYPSF|nr:hypothetical protein HYPSUDRAFT_55004 [Hypholoma sublateritium FD-334 SS-4]